MLRPKPLPWSKPLCLSKCEKIPDLCPSKIHCEPVILPKFCVGCEKKKCLFNKPCKPLFEDNCEHKSGECLYEFCRDCKEFVHDKLVDLKHCVVKDICNKLQEKVAAHERKYKI